MSGWQLREILNELEYHPKHLIRYVWIDKIAVPQKNDHMPDLQGTLLSRMMAVYASAKLTLALRSDESTRNETFSRYHQRSWTAQEFVNANHLRVCDQPGIQEAAVTKDEDNIFQELRDMASMEIQQAAPLWLDKRMQPENQPTEADKFFKVIKLLSTSKKVQSSLKFHKLAESVAIFGELEQLVDASVKRDKVLALLPMLSNVVVANIQELSTLVTMCEEASDLFQPLKNRSIKLRTLLEQEDGEASNEKAGGAGVTTMVTDKTDLDVDNKVEKGDFFACVGFKGAQYKAYPFFIAQALDKEYTLEADVTGDFRAYKVDNELDVFVLSHLVTAIKLGF
eukprot:gene20415-24453_t